MVQDFIIYHKAITVATNVRVRNVILLNTIDGRQLLMVKCLYDMFNLLPFHHFIT